MQSKFGMDIIQGSGMVICIIPYQDVFPHPLKGNGYLTILSVVGTGMETVIIMYSNLVTFTSFNK